MGKIKIISNKPAKVYIDRKDLGTIKKETKEYEVEKGEHEIYAKASWCGSQKIKVNLNDDEIITFTLNSFQYEDLSRAIMMVFVMFFMLTKSVIFIIIAGLILLYPLYYLTFGSNKYLELKIKK